MGTDMRVDLPFLMRSRRADGTWRYRYRRGGVVVPLPGSPGDPEFQRAYDAARRGATPAAPETAEAGSLRWLVTKYLAHLEAGLARGQVGHGTVKQRRHLLGTLLPAWADHNARTLPDRWVRRVVHERADRPASAATLLKAIRGMYAWGMEAGLVPRNPATAVRAPTYRTEGFRAWTVADLRKFTEHHKLGTAAHLALMLLVFTACRRSDLAVLGRQHIKTIEGVTALSWRQAKTSTTVEVPILPPLAAAIDTVPAGQMTFLITPFGRPYTPAGLGNKMRDWCTDAGLSGLSAHGVRKASGGLLAELGCTEHQIMAVLGHASPRVSAIYTRSARRWTLALDAMKRMEGVSL